MSRTGIPVNSEAAAGPRVHIRVLSLSVPLPPSGLAARTSAHRRARTAAWALTRGLVADHSGCPPERQAWQRTPHGKPFLTAPRGLHVSLSHATTWAHPGETVVAAALSEHAPVGVDVEPLRPVPDPGDLARAALADVERRTLDAVDGEERDLLLLRYWTRKESVAKALGAGLATGFESVVTTPNGALLALPGHRPSDWSLTDLAAGPRIVAAVAVPAPDARISLHRLPEIR